MEVEGLGARCALATCRRLDYLPIRCAQCTRPFCSDHYQPSDHSCTAAVSGAHNGHGRGGGGNATFVPTCPLCHAAVPVPAHGDADGAMSAHIDAGCPKRPRSNPVCMLATCDVRDPAATACVACRKIFCIAHCIEANHDCMAEKRAVHGVFGDGKGVVAGARAQQAAGAKKKNAKAVKAATPQAKAARAGGEGGVATDDAMRLPGRMDVSNTAATALGASKVDEEDRIVLTIFFASGTHTQPHYVALNHRHSAGRILDTLHSLLPTFPSAPEGGARYQLYCVRSDLSSVNLMPYITPLRELPPVAQLREGDFAVVVVGEGGLDPSWMAALQEVAGGGRRWAVGLGGIGGGAPMGRKLPKVKGRKGSSKCLVA